MTTTVPRPRRVAAHAYPWDVIGDPEFATRASQAHVHEVTLAATYHGTRAATPQHPAHRVVDAPQAALYRPVRPSAWADRSLVPVPAPWVASPDPFAEAATALAESGLRVNAWVVLAHSTRLGTLRPDIAVTNCFGDRYPYALCPSQPEVRDYCATLAYEALSGVPVDGVSIEGCGQMGVAHNGLHEKTDGAYGPAAQRLLSVCCCAACQAGWAARGLGAREARHALEAGLARAQREQGSPSVEELLGAALAEAFLATRRSSQDLLRAQVLGVVREVAPGARVTLHGQADPWATGASPAASTQAAAEVDAVLVPAWAATPATAMDIAAMRAAAAPTTAVGAYVSVLSPATLGGLQEHVDNLLSAGADELHLYHLGLAGSAQLQELAKIAARAD